MQSAVSVSSWVSLEWDEDAGQYVAWCPALGLGAVRGNAAGDVLFELDKDFRRVVSEHRAAGNLLVWLDNCGVPYLTAEDFETASEQDSLIGICKLGYDNGPVPAIGQVTAMQHGGGRD